MTLRRKLALGGLVIVFAFLVCVAWLLGTNNGARFLLARAQPYLPAELSLGELRGSLIGGIDIVSVDWNAEKIDVTIRNLFIEVEEVGNVDIFGLWINLGNDLAWLVRAQLQDERIVIHGSCWVEDNLDVNQAGVLRINFDDQADFVIVKANQAANRVGP